MNRVAICLLGLTVSLMLSTNASAMYDPGLGRFCSRDPIGFEGSQFSVVAFCRNAPLHFNDPLGLYWSSDDYFHHYYKGYGRPVTLTETGLASQFESYHKSKINAVHDAHHKSALSYSLSCPNGAGNYSHTLRNSGKQNWDSTWAGGPMVVLGRSWVHYTGISVINWTCEICCDGKPHVTWSNISTTTDFSLRDAFTNPYPRGWGQSDPPGPAHRQGECINVCYKKYLNRKSRDYDEPEYEKCKAKCQQDHPTNDSWGIPYGITHDFSRTSNKSTNSPCFE